MQNSSRSPDARSHCKAPLMIWLGRSENFALRSSGRRIGVAVLVALLIVAAIELHPVTPAPAYRCHPLDCWLWRCCE